jgi:hypothetical protein
MVLPLVVVELLSIIKENHGLLPRRGELRRFINLLLGRWRRRRRRRRRSKREGG